MAYRLVVVAASEWPRFDGWCASRNVDQMLLTLDRFVNLVEHWVTRTMDEEKLAKFEGWLYRADGMTIEEATREVSGAWSREAELAQFQRS